MPKVSSRRQITLPVEQCRLAGIEPGDHFETFVGNDGHITIVKKVAGAANGFLKGVRVKSTIDEDSSRQSSIGGK